MGNAVDSPRNLAVEAAEAVEAVEEAMAGDDRSQARGGARAETSRLELEQLAHDLLQPVATIRALVSLVQRDRSVSPAMHERLQQIEHEAELMASMCQRTLEGGSPVEPIDLGAVTRAVVERTRLTYRGDIRVETDEVRLLADEVGWRRAVANLIENACRAAGPSGKVMVSVERSLGQIRVGVADSGPGFGKGHPGTASLGLATVSSVVDRHAGHLELRRSDLGGALVVVVLPDA